MSIEPDTHGSETGAPVNSLLPSLPNHFGRDRDAPRHVNAERLPVEELPIGHFAYLVEKIRFVYPPHRNEPDETAPKEDLEPLADDSKAKRLLLIRTCARPTASAFIRACRSG